MAVTRIYLSSFVNASKLPSSFLAGWTTTASSDTRRATNKLENVDAGGSTGSGGSGAIGSGANPNFSAGSRFILLLPLAAQTIAGNIKGQMRAIETASANNCTLAVGIKVIKPDLTDRGVLLAVSASDNGATQPPEMATGTSTNRNFQDVSENTSIVLSSLAVTAGDFLVIETGARFQSTATSAGTPLAKADLTAGDLPEDTTTTTDNNAWIEFDSAITFLDQPYYLDSASTPADGAATTNTADPTVVTPPTGMLAGDLVFLVGHKRLATGTLAMSATGGQTWTAQFATDIHTTVTTGQVFTCTFNGTWSADPSISMGATTCNSAYMHVFRPPDTNYTWALNVAAVELDNISSPFTITGQTTLGTNPTVTLAGWLTGDDNTWGTLSGTGWEVTGTAQYRNTSGSDQSATFAHKIQTAAGATGNVEKTQLTLGDNDTTTFILTMEAVRPRYREPVNRSFAVQRASGY